MMRSWDARADSAVVDEPFYAYYLARTGLDHPGREEVLRSQSTDWRVVASQLTSGPLPDGAVLGYQKHMTHHLLDEVDRGVLASLRHAFLIRDPADVLVSYAKVRRGPTLADLGLVQQVELHERFGGPVIDARDVLEQPETLLRALCAALSLPYDPGMLTWSPGPRATDGVWAPHWYVRVSSSTGFAPYAPRREPVPSSLVPLLEQCRPYYAELARHRLRP